MVCSIRCFRSKIPLRADRLKRDVSQMWMSGRDMELLWWMMNSRRCCRTMNTSYVSTAIVVSRTTKNEKMTKPQKVRIADFSSESTSLPNPWPDVFRANCARSFLAEELLFVLGQSLTKICSTGLTGFTGSTGSTTQAFFTVGKESFDFPVE